VQTRGLEETTTAKQNGNHVDTGAGGRNDIDLSPDDGGITKDR